jgi:hypothetical protein
MVVVSTPISVGKRGTILALADDFLEGKPPGPRIRVVKREIAGG